ncbi:Short-chain dehydrogenase/reductase SDR [Macleaya cordata]|uniref:Short-chain dehydrogenase/reductase SDR n=1 Tax=Macleaya cordata TaxID=56857 RepID=A0A200QGS7_MACCD|nr:Short-chain dehydrogenase/reductase SDR [Macleaya cordata]
MELIHVIMDLVVPPIILVGLLIIIPPYLIYKFVSFILRSFSIEDLTGKVVLITGASSGIGEYLAYAYAKRGARLVLVARREKRLREVAEKARGFGSPDVLVSSADVSKVEDCKRFVEEAVHYFGRLDHLVNNAGITSAYAFEDVTDITLPTHLMNVNFWGSIYPTHFAIPHLRKSKGKIVVIASLASWLYAPNMIFYGASKAAMYNFFETLRVELGSSVAISIVSPGFIESEMTQGKHLSENGTMELDPQKRDAQIGMFPVRGVMECANTIVHGVCRGDRNITDPSWFRILFFCKVFVSDVVEWFFSVLFVSTPGMAENDALGKKILDVTGLKKFIYPASIASDIKAE